MTSPADTDLQRDEALLFRRAARGSYWTLAGYVGEQGVRFVGNVVLARLLTSADFGLNLLVAVFLQGLQMFSDIGIQPSVVRSPRGDAPRFLDTAWTVQLFRGAFLYAVAIAVAGPYAAFYQEPLLLELVPAAAAMALLDGVASTKLVSAQRHLQASRLAILRVLSHLIGLAVSIVHGAITHSVWCLVIGALTASACRSLLSFLMLPGRGNRLFVERAALAELLAFGRWVFVSTALTFLANYLDRLIFGAMFTKAQLGVYYVAASLAAIPGTALSHFIYNIVFPLYSRVAATGVPLRDRVVAVRGPLLDVSGWLTAGMIAAGDAFVRVMYKPEFHDAGWMLQLLSLSVWILSLENQSGSVLLAIGQPRWVALGSGAKALAMFPLIGLGLQLAGIAGAIAALVVTELVRYLVVAYATARHRVSVWRDDLLRSLRVLSTGALGAGASWILRGAGVPAIADFAAVVALTTLLWASSLVRTLRLARAI